jgi:hypothetical protein
MTYVSGVQFKKKSKKKRDKDDAEEDTTPSFFIYPKKQKKFTLLKAPMAHKTFSQEQFRFKFHHLGISFNSSYTKGSTLTGVNNILFLALYLRADQTPFESNLFFLKKVRFSMTGTDSNYFTLR